MDVVVRTVDLEAVEAGRVRRHAGLVGDEALHVDLLAERQVLVAGVRAAVVAVDLGGGALGQTDADLLDERVAGLVADDGLDVTADATVVVVGAVVRSVGSAVALVGFLRDGDTAAVVRLVVVVRAVGAATGGESQAQRNYDAHREQQRPRACVDAHENAFLEVDVMSRVCVQTKVFYNFII